MATRKYLLRRAWATWQGLLTRCGKVLLDAFPFLRPPAEWAVERLDAMMKRHEARLGREPNWSFYGLAIGLMVFGVFWGVRVAVGAV